MEQFLVGFMAAIPILKSAVTVAVVGFLKKNVLAHINPAALALLVPIAVGVASGLGNLLGIPLDLVALANSDAAAWESFLAGVFEGTATVGLHQAIKKAKTVKEEGVISK